MDEGAKCPRFERTQLGTTTRIAADEDVGSTGGTWHHAPMERLEAAELGVVSTSHTREFLQLKWRRRGCCLGWIGSLLSQMSTSRTSGRSTASLCGPSWRVTHPPFPRIGMSMPAR